MSVSCDLCGRKKIVAPREGAPWGCLDPSLCIVVCRMTIMSALNCSGIARYTGNSLANIVFIITIIIILLLLLF